jgi:hypothetical protein
MVWLLVVSLTTGSVETGSFASADACAKAAARVSATKLAQCVVRRAAL